MDSIYSVVHKLVLSLKSPHCNFPGTTFTRERSQKPGAEGDRFTNCRLTFNG